MCEDCYTANLSNCRRRHVICDTESCFKVIRFLYLRSSVWNQCLLSSLCVPWRVMRMRTRMRRTLKCWRKCWILWQVQWFCELCDSSVVTTVCIRRRTSNPGPRQEEQRANRNVKSKTVWVEPLAVRTHPQENGLDTSIKSGTPQHRHNFIMTSVRPQAAHDKTTACQATPYLMR